MQTPNIMILATLVTVLFTQSAAASSKNPEQQVDTGLASQEVPASASKQPAELHQEAGSAERYIQLLQRIREDSLRQLSQRLDTNALLRELVGTTVRSVMDVTSNQPQL